MQIRDSVRILMLKELQKDEPLVELLKRGRLSGRKTKAEPYFVRLSGF